MSQVRGARELFISRPRCEAPEIKLSKELVCQVGGFMGVMADKSVTEIFVTKNEFYFGEKAWVRVVCDNLKCDKPVKSFKLKVSRKYIGLSQKRAKSTELSGYIATIKLPGCPAKSKVDRILEIDLPAADIQKPLKPWSRYECDKDVKFGERIGQSVSGRLIMIEYHLNVFVKHDSWSEFGEGNCISVPIRVLQPPIEFTHPNRKNKPADWSAQSGDIHKLALGEFDAFYYDQVILPQEKQWRESYKPILMSKEQLKAAEA